MSEFGLSRYLYSNHQVYRSLLMALLDHKTDEALFWAYEMYYSGFAEETVELLERISSSIYEKENPKLKVFVRKTIEEWKETPEKDWLLGSLVATLAPRDYCLADFITTWFKVKCNAKPRQPNNQPKMMVRMSKECIERYRTKQGVPFHSLCVFSVWNHTNQLFDTDVPEKDIFNTNWLYYACRSPIWESRVRELGGEIDDEKETVSFATDEQEEAFYEAYNYEPDELPLEIKEKLVGCYAKNTPQMTLKEFCVKYGVELVLRKLVIKKSQNSTNLSIDTSNT